MSSPLSDSDIKTLREVVGDPPGSIRNIPTGRSVTAERLGPDEIELRVQSAGPADVGAAEAADQVLAPGWDEVESRYPGERVFRGRTAT